MTRGTLCALVLALMFSAFAHAQRPALVVVMMVDGLPQEQLVKYRDQYAHGGFAMLLDKGAWFSDAHQDHAITITAPGHAAVLTGSYPYRNGIIANGWVDRNSFEDVYNTSDPAHSYIGERTRRHDGTSPAKLRVSTLGDELRESNGGRSKVVTVAGKARSAILLAGHRGTAYIYMAQSGRFASSTYYMKAHPEWHARYYASQPQEKWSGQAWTPLLPEAAYARSVPDSAPGSGDLSGMGSRFPFTLPRLPDQRYFGALMSTPFGDEAVLEFARAAIEGEHLGANPTGATDLLGVSLSTHDIVNHVFGPESRASHDHLLRIDRALTSFFDWLDHRIGLGNMVIVFTSDHGFANLPEYSAANGRPAMRIDARKLIGDLNTYLQQQMGIGPVARLSDPTIVLDPGLGARRAEAEALAARFLADYQGVAAVFTRTQLETRSVATAGRIGMLVQRAWHPQLSGDLYFVMRPYAQLTGWPTGTTHGSPYSHDTHVPIIFHGPRWIREGKYDRNTAVVDIAPTLAQLLKIRPPGASEGRVLEEILK